MKTLILVVLSYILLNFSLNARELTRSERQAISAHPQAMNVLDFMVGEIDTGLMSWSERMNFRVYRNSCLPVDFLLAIIAAEDDIEDQSEELHILMHTCLAGVVQVTNIYRRQR
jgi:hypothetical protein